MQYWSDYISESKAKFFWMFLANFVEKWEHKVRRMINKYRYL
jgi:hypothetical protein